MHGRSPSVCRRESLQTAGLIRRTTDTWYVSGILCRFWKDFTGGLFRSSFPYIWLIQASKLLTHEDWCSGAVGVQE